MYLQGSRIVEKSDQHKVGVVRSIPRKGKCNMHRTRKLRAFLQAEGTTYAKTQEYFTHCVRELQDVWSGYGKLRKRAIQENEMSVGQRPIHGWLCWFFPKCKRNVLVSQGCHNKVPGTRWFKQQTFIFFQFRRMEVCNQAVDKAGFFLSSLSLACKCHPLPVSSHGHPSVCLCVLISSSCKDAGQIRLGPVLKTSFQLNYLFRDPVCRESHSEFLGIRNSTYKFCWG